MQIPSSRTNAQTFAILFRPHATGLEYRQPQVCSAVSSGWRGA